MAARKARAPRWNERWTPAKRSMCIFRHRIPSPPIRNIGVVPVAIAVRARLFARLREQAGTEAQMLELPAGSNLADSDEGLRLRHPRLAHRSGARAALDFEFSE